MPRLAALVLVCLGVAPPAPRRIRKALDYVAPYVDPATRWPGRQITPIEPDWAVLLLERARIAYGEPRYGGLLRKIPGDVVLSHRARLL